MFGIDDAIMAAAIPAVLDVASGFMTNQSNKDIANQANQFSAAQADKQMQFQKDMRATQYQTAVDDLQKAGLNPMLAYSQGGSGNLAGAAGAAQIATLQNPLKGMAQTATGASNMAMQYKLTDSQVNESISRTTVNEQNAKLTDAQIAKTIAEIPNIDADTRNKLVLNMLYKAQTGATSAQEQATRQAVMIAKPEEAKSKTEWGKLSPYIKDVSSGVSSAVNAKQLIKGK